MTPANVLLLSRLGSGALLTAWPAQALRLLGYDEDDATSRTVVQVLGVRHLVQGAAEAAGTPSALRLGAGVDLLHALSALVFSSVSDRGRSAGRRSAALALGFAVAELALARRAPTDASSNAASNAASNASSGPQPVLPPGAPTTQLGVLHGGVLDGAEVAVNVADQQYTVTAVKGAEAGPQRYVRTARTVLIGGIESPVFALDEVQGGDPA